MFWLWVAVGLACVLTLGWLAWRATGPARLAAVAQHARTQFAKEQRALCERFFAAAAHTGKPRGLRWKQCTWEDVPVFARDRKSQEIVALLGVTIAFEAIEGGDMEGVAAVSNLRNASAVFVFARGAWQTAGHAVFNLNPDEALHHFRGQYDRL